MPQADPPSRAGGSSSGNGRPAFGPDARPRPATPLALVSELGGSLPCVRCKYDLKGLSILGHCPECGTPVRATLLAVVDPRAGELQPIRNPRLTAAGLLAWAVAGLLAALLGWAIWLILILPSGGADRFLPALRIGVMGCVVISGLGAAALINPHPGIKPQHRRMAVGGVAAYAALACTLAILLFNESAPGTTAGTGWASTDERRALLGIGIAVSLGLIILLLRPNARLLAARSVLLREGRVDRQTLLGLVAVLSLAAIGDSLSLIGLTIPAGETILLLGQALLLAACLLFTIGLIGVVIDCWRIHKVVLDPPLSLESLLEPALNQPATPGSKPNP